MRTLLLPALIITTTALFALAGCAKKEEPAAPKTKTAAPTGAKTTTKTRSNTGPAQAGASAAKSDVGTPTGPARPKAGNPRAAQATAKVTYFGQVLYSWNSGKKGDAVNQFLQLSWQDPNVFMGVPAMIMSEKDVASLTEEQRNSVSKQVQQFSQAVRDLAQAVIASTDSFIASGNAVGAKSRIDAVQQFGQALTAPERLEVVQSVGKAIADLAQQKSSAVK
jgi:hypothetical protein